MIVGNSYDILGIPVVYFFLEPILAIYQMSISHPCTFFFFLSTLAFGLGYANFLILCYSSFSSKAFCMGFKRWIILSKSCRLNFNSMRETPATLVNFKGYTSDDICHSYLLKCILIVKFLQQTTAGNISKNGGDSGTIRNETICRGWK